jgi:hypothetical protein
VAANKLDFDRLRPLVYPNINAAGFHSDIFAMKTIAFTGRAAKELDALPEDARDAKTEGLAA